MTLRFNLSLNAGREAPALRLVAKTSSFSEKATIQLIESIDEALHRRLRTGGISSLERVGVNRVAVLGTQRSDAKRDERRDKPNGNPYGVADSGRR